MTLRNHATDLKDSVKVAEEWEVTNESVLAEVKQAAEVKPKTDFEVEAPILTNPRFPSIILHPSFI